MRTAFSNKTNCKGRDPNFLGTEANTIWTAFKKRIKFIVYKILKGVWASESP